MLTKFSSQESRSVRRHQRELSIMPTSMWHNDLPLASDMSRRAMRTSGSLKTKIMLLLSLPQYYIY